MRRTAKDYNVITIFAVGQKAVAVCSVKFSPTPEKLYLSRCCPHTPPRPYHQLLLSYLTPFRSFDV